MKKNFFKKLSFVMALAMILSVVAPAAGVFAKAAPALNAKAKFLYLDVAGKNEFDFNVSNKSSGWTYKWYVGNTKVVTIDSVGVVTAKAAGSTKIAVAIYDKSKKLVKKLYASVYVRDNIKSLTITGTPADNKVLVGKENDFNRTYVTEANKTSGSYAVTRWEVTAKDEANKDGATIVDNTGVFTATKTGEYTVTARAFQSKTKYESWKADRTTYAANVTATAEYKVNVVNDIKGVAAVSPKTFKVDFLAAIASADKTNFTLVNNSTSAKPVIKGVTLSTDKLSATVELYDAMASGTTYSVTAKLDNSEMKGEFNYVKGTPVKIEAPIAQTAPADAAYKVKYTVYDENGLDITADTNVNYEASVSVNANGEVNLSNGVLAYVTVIYYNPVTGASIKSPQIAITGATATGNDFLSYTLQKTGDPANFDKPVTSIKLNTADTWTLKIKVKDQYGNEVKPANGTNNVTFENLDPSIFVIDQLTGVVTPVKEGIGSLRIKYGNINVIKTLEVKAEAKADKFVSDKASVKVSDTGRVNGVVNSEDVKVNYKDQFGDNFNTGSSVTLKLLTTNADNKVDVSTDGGTTYVPLTAASSIPVNTDTTVKFKAHDNIDADGTVYVQFKSSKGDANVLVYYYKAKDVMTGYKLDGVKDLDINHKYDGDVNTNDDKTDIKVFSTNDQGFKVQETTGTSIEIKKADGTTLQKIDNILAGTTTTLTADSTDTTANINFYKGVVTVEARRGSSTIATASFTVKDSGAAPSITLKSNKITQSVSTTNLANLLDGLGTDWNVVDFKYVSSNGVNVATRTAFGLPAPTTAIGGSASLYNTVVLIQNAAGRQWEITLGTLDASVN